MELIYDNPKELYLEFQNYLEEQKKLGKKIIGYSAHEFIPFEILRALNVIPVPLIFAGTEERNSIGSGYLTPTMCPFALSIFGVFDQIKQSQNQEVQDLSFLNLIDGIIATNYCVADLLVNEYITDKYNLKLFNLHIPFLQRPHHEAFYKSELLRLLKEISEFTHTELDIKEFSRLIEKSSIYKETIRKLIDSEVHFTQKLKVIHKSMLFGFDYIDTSKLNTLVEDLVKQEENVKNKRKRVILMGSSLFIDDSLIDVLEESNCEIAVDSTWLSVPFLNLDDDVKIRSVLKDLSEESNKSLDEKLERLLDIYVERYHKYSFSLHFVSDTEPFNALLEYIKKLSEKYKSISIINHIIKFCDLTGHHRQDIKNMLTKQGFQVLNLERDYARRMDGQLKTRIEAFLEMIE